MHKVGVSILTNGTRLDSLQACVSSLLANCYFRPLVIAVFNNGSTDGTHEWCLEHMRGGYGIKWVYDCAENDLGCAAGTNRAAALVKDCEYVLHLESDFRHIPAVLTGCNQMWMHQTLEFMESGRCEYLYLRRMMNERDIAQHWWAQWADKITTEEGCFLECPGFWWSNNPHLRLNQSVYAAGCLPLNEGLDGPKGTPGWSQPELKAPRPTKTWIHKWGLFVHDAPQDNELAKSSCPLPDGCKYGFFKKGPSRDMFCQACDLTKDFREMKAHHDRFRKLW